MATPYLSQGRTTRYEDRCDLEDILQFYPEVGAFHARQLSLLITDAGFTRPQPARITGPQLFSYFSETVLLAVCAGIVSHTPGLGFVFGALVAMSFFGALTFLGALVINHSLNKKGFRK